MLQSSEIQKRFSHLQQTINEASRVCGSGQSIPQDLKDCVDELDQQWQSAQSTMSSQDEDSIRECVDRLEEIGDRAERACQNASGVDEKVKQCVDTLHSELSDFKQQLH